MPGWWPRRCAPSSTASRSEGISPACIMDPSSIRDAGMQGRGHGPVIVLFGGLAVGLSFAASPELRGAWREALALLMMAAAIGDFRYFTVPDALAASAFGLGLISACLFDDAPLA